MTPRPDQKQDTRRRIVAAAAARIRDEGLESPSVAQVMADAGLTVGGFYAHFDSRDTLMAEALAQMLDDQMQRWLEMLPDTGPAERRMQRAAICRAATATPAPNAAPSPPSPAKSNAPTRVSARWWPRTSTPGFPRSPTRTNGTGAAMRWPRWRPWSAR
jgi:AcrR family transcriptional regulator